MRKVLVGAVAADREFRLRAGTVSFLVAAAFGFGSHAAHAQESPVALAAAAPSGAAPVASAGDNQLEEVVVTARKRSESMHDIPATVQAISASTIAEAHLTQLDDIGTMVSNLNIFEAHDNSPAVVMRGVGSFELVQGVGFYMNDVQLTEGQTVRPMDIERIEILKGPQGTLYGGANIGGAIKYVTKDPTPTWKNEVTAEIGNDKTRNVAAVLSGPIAEKLGVRASIYDDNSGGYIWDNYHHETIGASHDRGGRIVFLAEPQATTNIRFAFNTENYSSQNENLQYRVSEIDPTTQTTPYTAGGYRYSVDDYFIPSFARKIFASTLQVEHQFNDGLTLTSITAHSSSFERGVTDLTKKPIPLDKLIQDFDHRDVSQELRLGSTAHSNLDWLVGAVFQQHKIDQTFSNYHYTGDIPEVLDVPPFDYDVQNQVQKQYAVFGDATYYMGDWQYELGLRAENYKVNLHARNDPGAGLTTFGPQDMSGNMLSPRVSIQYKLNAGTNLYGTLARGFQPGTLSEQGGAITTIRAETAMSYELGVKAKLAHGAQVNAAVFLVDYKDRLYQNLVAVAGSFADINTNIGPSRNTGVEVEFQLPLATEFKLSGGIGTTRAVWGNVPNYAVPQAGNATMNLNGLTAPFTPAYTANLVLDWNRALSNGWKVGARLDGAAVGQSYWDPNDYARQKAYQLMNAGAHIESGPWTWIAHVSNLTGTRFNTMYWDSRDVGGPPPVSFARINRPRMMALSATYRF